MLTLSLLFACSESDLRIHPNTSDLTDAEDPVAPDGTPDGSGTGSGGGFGSGSQDDGSGQGGGDLPGGDDTPGDDIPGDDTPGDDTPGGWDPTDLPDFVDVDCPGGYLSTWNADPFVLTSTGGSFITSLEVPFEGRFAVYEATPAESGDSQTNESAFLRISSLANLTGLPEVANCQGDWVFTDADNAGPPTGLQYAGTFWLGEGTNTVEALHFCEVWRTGACDDLHVDWGTSCDPGHINSVHFQAEDVCLIPVL